ncbi:MAG: hypothetical protein AAGA48_31305 [Myxococcota bacterium]
MIWFALLASCTLTNSIDGTWNQCGCVDGEVCLEVDGTSECVMAPDACSPDDCSDEEGLCDTALQAFCEPDGPMLTGCSLERNGPIRRVVECP